MCGLVVGEEVSASAWKGGVEDPLMVGLQVREAKYRGQRLCDCRLSMAGFATREEACCMG